jgi:hypothetical protein
MTDDDRIAHLTELARKVWNPRHHGIEMATTSNFASVSTDGGAQPLLEIHFHVRALDALEAALQVLAGEDRYESTTRYAKAMQERAEEWQRLADEHMEVKNEATARIAALEAELKKLSAELDWRRTLQTIHEDP